MSQLLRIDEVVKERVEDCRLHILGVRDRSMAVLVGCLNSTARCGNRSAGLKTPRVDMTTAFLLKD